MSRIFVSFLCLFFTFTLVTAQSKSKPKPKKTAIERKTTGMKKYSGYFNYYWDSDEGKVWLEIDEFDTEFLYVNSLTHGIGSNDIGLDRGQIGGSRLVKFQKVGKKVLLIQPNDSYRSISENDAEKLATHQSFAYSTLWGFDVEVEDNSKILVDASDFFLRDAHGIVNRLAQSEQGNYSLDKTRSAFFIPAMKNFPKNTEIEVSLTFVGNTTGFLLRRVVPSTEAITVHQHHSFIELPDDEFNKRKFDPRAGFYGIQFMDFSTPIAEPLLKRFINHHRIDKKNPNDIVSEPVKPIIYYVDRGAPEPIRSALIEGAQWWNQAFEAAGYKDAFQVKVLPEDADLMDVRYNVIQWVHRSTRGWSYGASVTDPRTGEIIKGHVTLGSQRVRQDYLIAEGLLAPYESGKPVSKEMIRMALARLRQLSAHEVGHTLGLQHNYAASALNRASVMDYPHPLIKIKQDGSLDLSDAYTNEIGEWDKVTIAYGYQDFPDGVDEDESLIKILEDSFKEGLIFISDADARPEYGAHPQAHLWDNGSNAVKELDHILSVRERALNRFSENNIQKGAPLATLEEVLVPIYMLHRYQLNATAKSLGGVYYTYAMRGDGQKINEILPPDEQRKALKALLKTIHPEVLALPENILEKIPPRPVGYRRNREIFKIKTGITFDPLAAAESAANLSIGLILNPHRAARLIEFKTRNEDLPSFGEVIDKLITSTWKKEYKSAYYKEIQRVVDMLVLNQLFTVAVDESALNQVRAVANYKINELKEWLQDELDDVDDESKKAHFLYAISQINQYQTNPEKFKIYQPVNPPDGPPIGMD